MTAIPIEWIDIPAGLFTYGLEAGQKRALKQRLWDEIGLDGSAPQIRLMVSDFVTKLFYWRSDKFHSSIPDNEYVYEGQKELLRFQQTRPCEVGFSEHAA